MARSYKNYIADGSMSARDAAQNEALRDTGRDMAAKLVGGSESLSAAMAFGALDVLAVRLVAWYGPSAAAEVFAHYGEVCARQKGTTS
jgi:hypothetical protein